MPQLRNLLGLLLIVLSLSVPMVGQETTGTITGLVSDPSGAVVANAEVTVVNTGTNATYNATTNVAGNYIIRTLPVGKLPAECVGRRDSSDTTRRTS